MLQSGEGAEPDGRRPGIDRFPGVTGFHRSVTVRLARVGGPTAGQIESYRRDGFLIVERFLDAADLDRVREHFMRVFEHEWETGLAPDEVNYVPGVTAPELTRQLCNVWKADRVLAGVTLSPQVGEFAARLAGLPGVRLAQDNAIWKPPSGKALLCHQDAAYLDHLDPPNMTTCWMALDDTAADTGTIYYVRGSHRWPHAPLGGTFHAPDDWLAHVHDSIPTGRRARAGPDRGPGRRRRVSRRLDVPRQPAERASGRAAAIDHQPHDLHRHAVEPGASSSDLLPLPAARRGRARRGVLPDPVAGRIPDPVAVRSTRQRKSSRDPVNEGVAGAG